MTLKRKLTMCAAGLAACLMALTLSAVPAMAAGEIVLWEKQVDSPEQFSIRWSNTTGRTYSIWLRNTGTTGSPETPYVFDMKTPMFCLGQHTLKPGQSKECVSTVYSGTTVFINGAVKKKSQQGTAYTKAVVEARPN